MYHGWVRAGARGAALVGVAFVAPSFLMVLVLAGFYVRFGGLPWMQGVFYGVGAAVVAIIALSTRKLAAMALARDPVHWGCFALTAVVTAWTESEIVWFFLVAGAVAMMLKAPPRRAGALAVALPPFLLTGVHGAAPLGRVGEIAWFFTKAGAFVFGSGLAIVPFLYGGVVQRFQWLDDRQFLDAVAVAMITPGPVVITSGFIGFLTAGPLGAIAAAIGTFVPPFLVVVLAARPMRRWSRNPSVKAFIGGVTASAAGAIGGAAFILARRAIVDWPTAAIAVTAGLVLWRWKKVPEPVLILIAAVAGLALSACKAPPASQDRETVLFVCEHGAAKSVIAATYFNQLAEERGLSARATARGADPQDQPSTATVAGLKADGLVPVVERPLPLKADDVRGASRIVAFDCEVATMRGLKSLDTCWDDVPTVSEDYTKAREAIRAHVTALVDEAALHRGNPAR
jgi:chromate transporter